MTGKSATIERKIRFYRAFVGLSESREPIPFDHESTFDHIDSLPWSRDGRYWESRDGDATCCWVHPKKRRRCCLAVVRRRALPQLERAGQLSPLKVAAGTGLAEQTHIVFFPNNIVGCEFNFYGPRISRMRHYLAEKAPTIAPNVRFDLLLRDDVQQRLERLEDLRLINLRMRPSALKLVEAMNADLGTSLNALADASKAHDVELVLRARPRSDETLSAKFLALTKRLFKNNDFRDEARRFVVRGRDSQTERIEELDLLADALISKRKIVRAGEDSRAVESDSAFMEIEAAYKEKLPEIRKATAIGDDDED